MNNLLSLIVFTSNVLGSFNDPFEFDGNYGEEVNPIREYVFEQVVSKEALASNLTDVQLGLTATSVGPTTIKKRMVTIQHSKAGRFAVDEEDYVMILKPDNGSLYQMCNPTIGFQEERPNPSVALPDIENPSDHYPVGVSLVPLR